MVQTSAAFLLLPLASGSSVFSELLFSSADCSGTPAPQVWATGECIPQTVSDTSFYYNGSSCASGGTLFVYAGKTSGCTGTAISTSPIPAAAFPTCPGNCSPLPHPTSGLNSVIACCTDPAPTPHPPPTPLPPPTPTPPTVTFYTELFPTADCSGGTEYVESMIAGQCTPLSLADYAVLYNGTSCTSGGTIVTYQGRASDCIGAPVSASAVPSGSSVFGGQCTPGSETPGIKAERLSCR